MTYNIDQLESDMPVNNPALQEWIAEQIQLTSPENVVFVNGSKNEWESLSAKLVSEGKLIKLNESKHPNSFLARSAPGDVARVESRTYICSQTEAEAGPTNNWVNPIKMRSTLKELFKDSMVGRTMYVIAYSMGPIYSDYSEIGVEITDSEYVVLSMHIMARLGLKVWEKLDGGKSFVKGLHSVGFPLTGGVEDVEWPCNANKYICHFPQDREIISFGSGYGGNALLGKKCFALRIASAMAHDEGWLAEHMLILKLTSPQGKSYFVLAAFPSQCGKTNLAMIQPTIPGWKAETIGDDIAWIRIGSDGRLYAINPEFGFFGVAPGTNNKTNPVAMQALSKGNTIYTNVALTEDGDVWWEGKTEKAPENLTDWLGQPWEPNPDSLAAHPNSRYTVPLTNCPTLAPEWDDIAGVPISAILFGGRRKTTVPLVSESKNWTHGVFVGATLSSAQTAAAEGKVGKVRYDPMAMLPFIGYNVGDYFKHWIDIQNKTQVDKLPKIFLVNWFGGNDEKKFLWPGFGDNIRVFEWIIARINSEVEGVSSPIGTLPKYEELNLDGLDVDRKDIKELTEFNLDKWKSEIGRIQEHLELMGTRVPEELYKVLNELRSEIASS